MLLTNLLDIWCHSPCWPNSSSVYSSISLRNNMLWPSQIPPSHFSNPPCKPIMVPQRPSLFIPELSPSFCEVSSSYAMQSSSLEFWFSTLSVPCTVNWKYVARVTCSFALALLLQSFTVVPNTVLHLMLHYIFMRLWTRNTQTLPFVKQSTMSHGWCLQNI